MGLYRSHSRRRYEVVVSYSRQRYEFVASFLIMSKIRGFSRFLIRVKDTSLALSPLFLYQRYFVLSRYDDYFFKLNVFYMYALSLCLSYIKDRGFYQFLPH